MFKQHVVLLKNAAGEAKLRSFGNHYPKAIN